MEQLILRILLLKATSFAGIYFKAEIKILIFLYFWIIYKKAETEWTVPFYSDFVGLELNKSDKGRLMLYFLSSSELWDFLSDIWIPLCARHNHALIPGTYQYL